MDGGVDGDYPHLDPDFLDLADQLRHLLHHFDRPAQGRREFVIGAFIIRNGARQGSKARVERREEGIPFIVGGASKLARFLGDLFHIIRDIVDVFDDGLNSGDKFVPGVAQLGRLKFTGGRNASAVALEVGGP
jgi:hypothetical protein